MAGSSPGAAVRTGSPPSSSWWGAPASLHIREEASARRAAGDFAAAERLYQQGYQEALRHDANAALRYLASIGGCQLGLFRYREALDSFLQARTLAESIGDRETAGLIALNLSSTFLQMWDVSAAVEAAEQSRTLIQGLPHPYYEASLLLQLGRLRALLGEDSAEAFLAEGIEAARRKGDLPTETIGWDLLGEEYLRRRRLPEAERAFAEAFRLRALSHSADLGFSYERIAALKLAQGEIATADRFNQLALAAAARGGFTSPEHVLRHQRGRILLARGQAEAALSDLSAALEVATRWRLAVAPAMSSLTGANVGLERQIFESFIETAAEWALKTGDARRAAESFAALELNRAASLRESLALAEVWRKKLPAEYWESLGKLSAENARVLRAGGSRSAAAERLQLRLTEMESEAGRAFAVKKDENFRSQTSLNLFQTGLKDSELLLSFHLGGSESYLWTVTRRTLSLYRLAPAGRIRDAVERFREAVRAGRPEAESLGGQLYSELFGQLPPQESGQPAWLLSLDESLFELPFAALVEERKGGKAVYLVEKHSLQVVPGALLLRRTSETDRRNPQRDPWFLGVGDPIYNVADPRWHAASPSRARVSSTFTTTAHASAAQQLTRLVASADEVEASARSWQGGSTLLKGENARRATFLDSLAHSPAVVHLATHVLTPPRRSEQAFLAFGLGPSGDVELLSTSEVAMLRVPGSLVVMTGCATASGDARAGAGLLGLTRAWLMAGAGAVLATGWPVKDSPGDLFSHFYTHLQAAPAAQALRQAQLEMIRSGAWRASPSYWASYQVTGGAR